MTAPLTPLRAATVLCLRQVHDDVEVLFVRRGARATFMANAYVFPGGRVDPADGHDDPALAIRRCAARELFEEASLRVEKLEELCFFARWVTPTRERKRFDTDFFLFALPPDQTPKVDGQEVFDLRWYTPSAALFEYEAGQLNLPPPTACTLEELRAEVQQLRLPAGAAILPALLKACAARRPRALLPRLRADDAGGIEILMPWDPEYSSVEGDGEGEPATELAEGAAKVAQRIYRCTLVPPGVWQIKHLS
jgi:8-oxo-dGTP pyrophosphatase MutT (NUDIX family)